MLIGKHPGRTAPDELTVFESLGLAVEDLAAAEYVVRRARRRPAPARPSSFDPARGDPRRARADRGRGRPHAARPAARSGRACGDLAEAREPAADRLVQDPRRDERDPGGVSPTELARGVVTASAGNMAQGVAWAAREAGVPATIVVPDHAPQTKLDAIERLGGRVVKVPFERWWQAIEESRFEGVDGLFVHPVAGRAVMAGNGTIGLELVEDLPALDAVVVPFGGGGLSSGIASAVKQLRPGAA